LTERIRRRKLKLGNTRTNQISGAVWEFSGPIVMRKNCLRMMVCGLLSFNCVLTADTHSPPRLTVELLDGSRVIGTSTAEKIEFHSALLGDIKLEAKDICLVERVTSNQAKIATVNGDKFQAELELDELAVVLIKQTPSLPKLL
jgi:hypothetical protein